MTRLNVPALPGDNGGWFDVRPVSFLNADHQDEAQDQFVDLADRKRALLPPHGPDPANPAVMAEEEPVRLRGRDLHPRWGLLLGWVLEGNSYGFDSARLVRAVDMEPGEKRDLALAEAFAEERRKLPLPAWNVLRSAMDPYWNALSGEGPKETPPPDGTTTGTSSTT